MNIARELMLAILGNGCLPNMYEGPDGERLTRQHFASSVAIRRRELERHIRANDKVIISAERGIHFYIDLVSVWALGAIAVPYSPSDGKDHLETIRSISNASHLLDDRWELPNSCDEAFLHNEIGEFTKKGEHDCCAVLFTSGSTGKPKGVVLSQHSLLGNAQSTLEITALRNQRLFVNIPFHFTSCICHFLSACISGSTFIGIEKKLMFRDFTSLFAKTKASGFGGAPVQLRWLAESEPEHHEEIKARLKFAFSSGDHLPIDVGQRLCQLFPELELYTAYGLTELGGRFCILKASEQHLYPGSVGKPIGTMSVRIVSMEDQDREVPANIDGLILAKGDLISPGYLNNSDATKRAFRNGSLHTGDIGHLNEDGYLFVTGRANDVFKVNGRKVSAQIISDTLLELDVFTDVAVIGHEVPVFGTVPLAFCVLRNPDEFRKGIVLKYLRERLPNSHIPHQFIMLDKIPRTGSGKVQRDTLRKLLNSTRVY